jgi:arylsulfatase A-like enzyme
MAPLALLLAAAACGGGAGGHPRSVLVVTVDTLRRDAVGFLGAAPSPTPNLDALAREAVVFEDAYTVAPITLPAHTSLFSGLYPASHGVRDNGALRVPDAVETLAERLRARGYRTLASVSAFVLDPCFGLDQGFERYQAPPRPFGGIEINMAALRGAEAVDRLLAQLAALEAEAPGEPWLAWLHVYDPHAPYDAPGAPRGVPKAEAYKDEVRYADRELGRLFGALRARGLWDDLVVVVASDHGEGLDDGPEPTHGYFVHDPTVRIPLLLRHPDLAPARCTAQVSLVDVAPTLLDLLGAPADTGDFDGLDLAPMLRGGEAPRERTLLLESYLPWISHGWAPFEAGVRGQRKAIRSRHRELYDRAGDPREAHNLVAEGDEGAAAELFGEIDERMSALATRLERVRADVDSAGAGALEALGYAGAGGALGLEGRPPFDALPDTYEMRPLIERMDALNTALAAQDVPGAVAELRALTALDPGNASFLERLGEVLLFAGQENLDEAERALAAAQALRPGRARVHLGLATCARLRGDSERAVRELQSALALEPDAPAALFNLSLLQAERAERSAAPDEQRALYRESIALLDRLLGELAPGDPRQPAFAQSRANLARRLEQLGG